MMSQNGHKVRSEEDFPLLGASAEDKKYIDIDGKRIAYLTAGDPANPALIMVHGWLSHAAVWRQTFASFHHNHYCIALDLLGHGHSDKPSDGDYSVPAQSERVLKLADALGLETFSLAGHSMGGLISLYTALVAPDRIKRLILIAPIVDGKLSPYVRNFLKPIYKLGMNFRAAWAISRSAAKLEWYRGIFDGPFFYDRSQVTSDNFIDQEMATIEGIEIAAYRDLEAIDAMDLTEEACKIVIPTLIIFGEHDNTVPIQNGYILEKCMPVSELLIIEECGHVPMVEKPVEYLDALRRILPR